MGFLDWLFGKKGATLLTKEELVENDICPMCWGYQSYEDKFVEVLNDRDKAALNKDPSARKAFIQEFIEHNVTGIHLKAEGDRSVCPKCKSGYKKINTQAS